MHGLGVYRYADGVIYEGQYDRNGQMEEYMRDIGTKVNNMA